MAQQPMAATTMTDSISASEGQKLLNTFNKPHKTDEIPANGGNNDMQGLSDGTKIRLHKIAMKILTDHIYDLAPLFILILAFNAYSVIYYVVYRLH